MFTFRKLGIYFLGTHTYILPLRTFEDFLSVRTFFLEVNSFWISKSASAAAIMLPNLKFVASLLLPALLGSEQLVAAGRIPIRDSQRYNRRYTNSTAIITNATAPVVAIEYAVAVPALQILSPYVCPSNANSVKRQSTGLSAITIPGSELRDLLLSIRILEEQIVVLIDALLLETGLETASSSGLTTITVTSTITPIPIPSTVMATVPVSTLTQDDVTITVFTTLPASTVTQTLGSPTSIDLSSLSSAISSALSSSGSSSASPSSSCVPTETTL